jgi:NAD(P)-dependent dehydrogenase (short-subunit alcohol dehydrogenase family)
MPDAGSVVVIGGTRGIGLQIARHYADRGHHVVISGRDAAQAQTVAKELGGSAVGIGLELTLPEEIAAALADVGQVKHLVLAAIDRDDNTARDYDLARALRLVTLKLVGYTEVVHVLVSRMDGDSSMVLFGGRAKDRPYVGAMTVASINAAVAGMVRALGIELAPIRVNAIHPGIVGDSPYWSQKPDSVLEGFRSRTPTGRLATMQDVVGAVVFLLENRSVNGVELYVDGGWLML